MTDPKSGGGSNSIPEAFAVLYYKYGLHIATHPIKVIILAVATVLALCTPLRFLPLPGYLPQEHVTLLNNYSVPAPESAPGPPLAGLWDSSTPLWYQGPPAAYVQQVVVRTTVVPWQEGVTIADSIRGPLFTTFQLSELISDFQLKEDLSLVSECLLVEEAIGNKKNSGASLPNYNCMMVSPADLWSRNAHAFVGDRNVLATINAVKSSQTGALNVGDILFGVPEKDLGIGSKASDPQVMTYAITIVLKRYSKKFVLALEKEVSERLSLNESFNLPRTYLTHLYFPSGLSPWELLMIVLYIFLFLSMYFSVLKMNGLYSKLGLAFSVLFTMLFTLGIAVSMSSHLGWRPLHSRWNFFYPVLSGLVGFENSMALIRSILSTPDHLDIKIRVAQGLAKEGWMITKYFLAMITTLTLSFFLFIPLVQEICINGSLVLLWDLAMQLTFLTAVICIDLRRSQDDVHPRRNIIVNPLFKYIQPLDRKESVSVPNLHRRHKSSAVGEDRIAPPQSQAQLPELPRRLRLTFFVVRKRIVQRLVMTGFIGWIAFLLFSADNMDSFSRIAYHSSLHSQIFSLTNKSFSSQKDISYSPVHKDFQRNITSQSSKILRHKHRYTFQQLPSSHWPYLFAYYNISLYGKYVTLLPAITLSVPVSVEEAKLASNPYDPLNKPWKPDLNKLPDLGSDGIDWNKESVIIPTSRGELIITGFLSIPALAFVMYAMVALYRCICPRNYGEWRSSTDEKDQESSSQIVGETVPLVLSGHPHDVECLSTDGSVIVSSCLAGAIYVWDPGTGECTGTILRKCSGANGLRSPTVQEIPDPDLPSSFSVPSLSSLPDLTSTISTDFTNQSSTGLQHINQLYEECNVYQGARPRRHQRNMSTGSITMDSTRQRTSITQPIWCMDCQDGIVYVGTGAGLIEVWDVHSHKAKTLYDDHSGIGVTMIKICGSTVVAARLTGSIDILQVQSAFVVTPNIPNDWPVDCENPFQLVRRAHVKAHQQPITVFTCDKMRIITGSLDHTLKILDMSDGSHVFTLHGHYGPVTAVALGAVSEMECGRNGIVVDLAGVNNMVASGAQDGSLCVWDVYTGTCVYSVKAHDSSVVNVVCTSSYILSLGHDRLCIWERFQGHLLNTLVMNQVYCTGMVMLTNRLLITGRQGSLNVWDITSGVPIRVVRLGANDDSTFIRTLLPVSGSVVCDYGNQLRVVRFPIAEKID